MEKIKIKKKREILKSVVLQCIPCTRTQPAQCARHLGLFKKRYCPNSNTLTHTLKTHTQSQTHACTPVDERSAAVAILTSCVVKKTSSSSFGSEVAFYTKSSQHLRTGLSCHLQILRVGCSLREHTCAITSIVCNHFSSVVSSTCCDGPMRVLNP